MYRGTILSNCNDYFGFLCSTDVAAGETTAVPGEETTGVPPGKTKNNTGKDKKRSLIYFKLLVFLIACYGMFHQVYVCHLLIRVATEESTALPNEETTAVPPGKTLNYMVKEKKRPLNSNCLVLSVTEFLLLLVFSSYLVSKVQKGLCQSFIFNVATGKTTAAPGEETTAVPPGKTPNYTEKEKKGLLSSNCFVLSVTEFLLLLVFSSYLLWKVQKGLRLSFLFNVATGETTAAPGEETTAVLPGKSSINRMEQEKKILLNSDYLFFLFFIIRIVRVQLIEWYRRRKYYLIQTICFFRIFYHSYCFS